MLLVNCCRLRLRDCFYFFVLPCSFLMSPPPKVATRTGWSRTWSESLSRSCEGSRERNEGKEKEEEALPMPLPKGGIPVPTPWP